MKLVCEGYFPELISNLDPVNIFEYIYYVYISLRWNEKGLTFKFQTWTVYQVKSGWWGEDSNAQ